MEFRQQLCRINPSKFHTWRVQNCYLWPELSWVEQLTLCGARMKSASLLWTLFVDKSEWNLIKIDGCFWWLVIVVDMLYSIIVFVPNHMWNCKGSVMKMEIFHWIFIIFCKRNVAVFFPIIYYLMSNELLIVSQSTIFTSNELLE